MRLIGVWVVAAVALAGCDRDVRHCADTNPEDDHLTGGNVIVACGVTWTFDAGAGTVTQVNNTYGVTWADFSIHTETPIHVAVNGAATLDSLQTKDTAGTYPVLDLGRLTQEEVRVADHVSLCAAATKSERVGIEPHAGSGMTGVSIAMEIPRCPA